MSLLAVAAALAAGSGASSPPAAQAATESEVHQLSRTNDALRAQLARERRAAARRIAAERLRAERRVAAYRRQLRHSPTVHHALAVAAATYGVPESRLRATATCESMLDPRAGNGPYLGLFQFGTPLWNRTPYRGFPRTDPYAAALAASWAFSRGMAGHWPVCG